MTERQIAADLIISYETVHQHGKVARERLDARSVSHALAICVERGYVVVIDGSLAPAPAVELVAA
jgi:DNA-binding CsgD family transcriptional regulator